MIEEQILFSTQVIFILVSILFLIGTLIKNNAIADIFWGLGFVVVSNINYFLFSSQTDLHLLINILITIWGLRLALHIGSRKKLSNEDYRYKNFRKSWKKLFLLRAYFQIYILQGTLLLIISTPVYILMNDKNLTLSSVQIIAVSIWLVGFYFEAVGDAQLRAFIKTKKKDEIMTKGLWKYTRHPNYFGEVLMWWSIFLFSFGSTNFLYGLISPILLTYLLLYVSGIPMLEKKYDKNKAFQKYKKETNALIPWFPKR